MPDERARAEEGGLVALAFLLGEADHLDAERQPPAARVQFAHAGHRHEDAEAPVVLAAVAHGVVVRAGQQRLRTGVAPRYCRPRCRPRRWRPRRSRHSLHSAHDLPRAGAVRVGEIGDGELALLGVARVAVLRQLLLPVPDQVAERRLARRTCRQPQLGDAVDVAQRLGSNSKSGWFSRRRAKVAMICCRGRPVPRGPRTARMKGKPNFAL